MEFAKLICHKSVIFLRCCMTFLRMDLKVYGLFCIMYFLIMKHTKYTFLSQYVDCETNN